MLPTVGVEIAPEPRRSEPGCSGNARQARRPGLLRTARLSTGPFTFSRVVERVGSGRVTEQPIRVLIVDDQDVFTNALRLWLNGRDGIEVVGVAHDGPEAIDLALFTEADVVLMDLGLPKIDGLEATRRLLSLRPSARVIALTGKTEDEAADAALDAGAVAFLTKGAVHEQLVGVIHSAVAH